MISPKVTVVFVMSLDSFPEMVFKSYIQSLRSAPLFLILARDQFNAQLGQNDVFAR